jgi:hypothetical protein
MRALKSIVLSVGMAAVVAGASFAVAAPASGAVGAADAARGLVISPRAGQTLPAASTPIRVRAPRGARVAVRLNGHAVQSHFRSAGRGVRHLVASPNHGLRHGANVLRVTVDPAGRARPRRQTVRFRIASDRPLAAAGLDHTASLHARITLSAHRSRDHRAVRGLAFTGRRPALRYRWRVIRAPRGSALARRTSGRRATATSAVNLGPDAAFEGAGVEATLTPDVPGSYRVELRATAGPGATSRDHVDIDVDPVPLVRVDTMAKVGDVWGVKVGNSFYPDPGKSRQWLQIVALDENDLALIDNRSFDCPQATDRSLVTQIAGVQECANAVDRHLNGLLGKHRGALVIAVSQRPDGRPNPSDAAWGVQPSVGVASALKAIGGPAIDPNLWRNTHQPILRGRMSFIGYLGAKTGTATHHINYDMTDYRDDGEIVGNLVRDNLSDAKGGRYEFVSGEYLPVTTRGEGARPPANGQPGMSVIEVGDRRFSEPYTRFGFHVVILERQGLAGTSRFFELSSDPDTAINRMIGWLSPRNQQTRKPNVPGDVVIIASAGAVNVPEYASDAFRGLADLIAPPHDVGLGGTRRALYWAVDRGLNPKPWSYSLIWSAGLPGAGGAYESAGPLEDGEVNSSPLTGALTRSSKDYGFDPTAVDEGAPEEVHGPGEKLREAAVAAPKLAWPETDDAGRTAAIAYVGGRHNIDSQRGLFWTQAYSAEFWNNLSAAIGKMTYPEDRSSEFSADDFEWAKDELQQEIAWLQQVNGYARTLAAPLSREAGKLSEELKKSAADINKLVQVPGESTVAMVATAVFDGLREGVTVIPEVGEIIHVLNVIYDLSMEFAKLSTEGNEEVEEPFSVSAAEQGIKLAERLLAAQDAIEVSLVNMIVSDYGKLRTVALCSLYDRDCPSKPVADWQVKSNYRAQAAEEVSRSSRAAFYSALLPKQYVAYGLPIHPSRATVYRGHQYAGSSLVGWHCPFSYQPASAQVGLPIYRKTGAPDQGERWREDLWQIVVYARQRGSATAYDPTVFETPEAGVLDPVVRSPAQDGLGIEPEKFWRRTYNAAAQGIANYPMADAANQWISPETIGFRHNCR